MVDTSRTLVRAVELLDCFTPKQPARSLQQLASATQMPRATVHRLVRSLEAVRLLTRSTREGHYELHPRLLQWSFLAGRGLDPAMIESVYLRKLEIETQETCTFSVLSGYSRTTVAQCLSSQAVCRVVELYAPLPLYCGAAGKAILAQFNAKQLGAYLRQTPLTQQGPNTLTSVEVLKRNLEAVRSLGYATADRERVPDGSGVAAPVFDSDNQIYGAVAIAFPAYRADSAQIVEWGRLVVAVAADIQESINIRSHGGRE
ncbi:IclR family transcriptional regulator [Segeticoccus rhizosphaerae]|uniref:IclR family transcriptional regulator n=1 Tax=Segeticoccus rhizosphaerae TaxID=1104777 RepID=UPI0010C12A14